MSRVFKPKYFHNGKFFGAQLRHNPSYVWCSIYASHVLAKNGSKWRVGNGTRINVWNRINTPWPRNKDCYMPTEPTQGMEELKVCRLIDQDNGCWSHNIVNNLFSSGDTQTILSMPLYHRVTDDIIAAILNDTNLM